MLVDRFGRTVNYLRLSVTDRCDFRCVYCMAEEMTFIPKEQLLSLEEMATIAQAFSELGVKKIRLTGGEPLIRRNVEQLLHKLGAIETLDELTLTTNGSQLTRLMPDIVKAGIKRINISLDSLQPERFRELTRTGKLDGVLAGIDSALDAGLKVKLNSVILKNRNSDEVLDLVDFALAKDMDIAFIEEMPLGHISEHQRNEEFISSAKLRTLIEKKYPLIKHDDKPSHAGPAEYWRVSHIKENTNSGNRFGKEIEKGTKKETEKEIKKSQPSTSRIGFISPHSNNFCAACNRVRLTATGQLLLCLGNEHSLDLRAVVRSHPGNTEKLKQAITEAMSIKPERHYFDLNDEPTIVRFMNTTGG